MKVSDIHIPIMSRPLGATVGWSKFVPATAVKTFAVTLSVRVKNPLASLSLLFHSWVDSATASIFKRVPSVLITSKVLGTEDTKLLL